MTGDWRDHAACRPISALFFETSTRAKAMHICRYHCPVLDACRTWAAGADLTGVVAGGLAWKGRGDKREPAVNSAETRPHSVWCRVLDKEEEE